MGKTLFDKIWDNHVVVKGEGDQPDLLFVDLQLIHEVTSPQAFAGLRENNRALRHPERTFGTIDHDVPTVNPFEIKDEIARLQIETFQKNCKEFGVEFCDNGSERQGIVHMVGHEVALTQPGKIIVCGDSHTATHGAFGAFAFGIGTSEVEHVMATQTIWQKRPKNAKIEITGTLPKGVYAKDVVLALIAKYGVDFGVGYACEFTGNVVEELPMEERATLSNMAIEGGAKIGMIAADQTTYEYLKGREYAPKDYAKAVEFWKTLKSDADAQYDKTLTIDVTGMSPYVTWGTNPEQAIPIDALTPKVEDINHEKAYSYIGLHPEQDIKEAPIDYVFIGSCTNGRASDFIEAAKFLKGKKLAPGVTGWAVPGSRPVKREIEKLGLDKVFTDAGFEWREPGCSACLAMNPDKIPSGKRCASTSNRNFEGRQGKGARTHLCSPAMAALAGINGHFVDVRDHL
ncbi:MAG: 3-isopropylmalate dehydratase large subunit [Lactobacillales bacterium]|jgi:3-isopropylmalate/(R)-2-methylmalate dehydratase large subunit|nr:3-isopropylmalate dehydratase large subunit [Lactobacillales bacterium]